MSANVSKNKTRIVFTIDKELKAAIEELCEIEHRSLSNLINFVLIEYLKNHKQES